jgi:DNA-binding NtrC family response regulator
VARVLLCEHDPHLSRILIEAFQDEHLVVTPCVSLEEIERALTDYPKAIVLTDSWTDSWQPALSASERDAILRLAQRTFVLVTTGRDWAQRAAEHDLGPRVIVVSKPYDLDAVLDAAQAAVAEQSRS